MLGLGRIIGDTAIIVVLLGATQNFAPVEGAPFPLNYLRGAGTTLTNFVYEASPTGNLNQPEKAYAAAFVLLMMVLVLNAAVDVVHRRARKVGTWSSMTPAADPAADRSRTPYAAREVAAAGPEQRQRSRRSGRRRLLREHRRIGAPSSRSGGWRSTSVSVSYGGKEAVKSRLAAGPPGRGAGADRALGLRQDDPAALAQPAHRADQHGVALTGPHPLDDVDITADRADPRCGAG